MTPKEVFDNWSAYLRPVDRPDFLEALQSIALSETPRISAGGAFELKLYGTPGYVGTIAGITIHADPAVEENTVIVRDEHGRELGRIINVGR
jgi:hypothetical protein